MKIGIIGGGIGGLSSAWYLRQQCPDATITVMEAGSRWGGVVMTESVDNATLEHGPDAILTAKPAAMTLIRELGLQDQVIGTQESARRAYVVKGQRLIPVPDGLQLMAPSRIWPFVTSGIISLPGKLRMACEPFIARRTDAGDESLGSFVRRRLGAEALESIAQPLIGAIHSADPDELSLQAVFPRFADWERDFGSIIRGMRSSAKAQPSGGDRDAAGPRYSLFATLQGGLGTLIGALVVQMQNDVALRLNYSVRSITRIDHGWRVNSSWGESAIFDAIIIAAPAHVAAQLLQPVSNNLLADLAAELSAALQGIAYHSVATVNAVFDRSAVARLPSGAGFVVPRREQRQVFACSFASQKFAGRCSAEQIILRAAVGGGAGAAHFRRSDEELLASALRDLRDLLGTQGEPRLTRVIRWPTSLPQYRVGHVDRVRSIRSLESQLPGFGLVGNAYEGTGLPDVIAGAVATARRLCATQTVGAAV